MFLRSVTASHVCIASMGKSEVWSALSCCKRAGTMWGWNSNSQKGTVPALRTFYQPGPPWSIEQNRHTINQLRALDGWWKEANRSQMKGSSLASSFLKVISLNGKQQQSGRFGFEVLLSECLTVPSHADTSGISPGSLNNSPKLLHFPKSKQ